MDAPLHEEAPGAVGRGMPKPFRTDVDELVAMFQVIDAATPAWHRARARTLLRDAKLQPIAAVTDAWSRLAARHLATAQMLEQQQAPADDATQRRHRFFRA
jgi:hypothetical protein